jgi:hypothetical protein
MMGHGLQVKKGGAVGSRRGCTLIKVTDLPVGIQRELKERGVIQSRIGTVKRHRGAEAARQAALG